MLTSLRQAVTRKSLQDPCPCLRIRVLMHELGAILRISKEPADGLPLCRLLGSLAGHFSSRDPALNPLQVDTGTLPKPNAVYFIRQIAHPDVVLNRWLPNSTLPPGNRGL